MLRSISEQILKTGKKSSLSYLYLIAVMVKNVFLMSSWNFFVLQLVTTATCSLTVYFQKEGSSNTSILQAELPSTFPCTVLQPPNHLAGSLLLYFGNLCLVIWKHKTIDIVSRRYFMKATKRESVPSLNLQAMSLLMQPSVQLVFIAARASFVQTIVN